MCKKDVWLLLVRAVRNQLFFTIKVFLEEITFFAMFIFIFSGVYYDFFYQLSK